MANQYEAARDIYAAWGVDTEEARGRWIPSPFPLTAGSWTISPALRILMPR